MKSYKNEFLQYALDLFSFLGRLSTKTLFGANAILKIISPLRWFLMVASTLKLIKILSKNT